MSRDVQDMTMEPLVDGMISLIRKNLVANTALTADAHAGDTEVSVEMSTRFDALEDVVFMDDERSYDPSTGQHSGVEWNKVAEQPTEAHKIVLKSPLGRDYLVSKGARMQKTVKRVVLYEKDVLYGDRNVIGADFVAVCVDPESKASDWLALHGLLGTEYRMAILVYVKSGASAEQEDYAIRVCNAYADTIENLLQGNIHMDLAIDEVPLAWDAAAGATHVYVSAADAAAWPPDRCCEYQVSDAMRADYYCNIVSCEAMSSSTSSSSRPVESTSTEAAGSSSRSSSSGTTGMSSGSSPLSGSTASESSTSTRSASSSSSATESPSSETTSLSTSSSSSLSSETSDLGHLHRVCLSVPLMRTYRVADSASLKRFKRYLYDSRCERVEYGVTQKGSAILKAARLSWYGKETEQHVFPQRGRG